MKRILMLLAAVVVLAGCLPGMASAASSPTVITGAVSKVNDTSVVLHGRVNPNGAQTGWLFDYGTTTAFGLASDSHSAGSGSKGVDVTQTITGLTPGTTYYYRMTATSTAGTSNGAVRHFATTGHPPAAVVTGAAVDVRKTTATPTGAINPEGAPTTWAVQYGLTVAYGLQTAIQAALPAVSSALPISIAIPGLAPATLFHYRLVAYHDGVPSYGADATFFTEPDRRPVPRLSARTKPGSDTKSPYSFTTTGTLSGAAFIPAGDRCTGNVGVRFFNGKRQVGFTVAPVGGDCKFSTTTTFRHTRARGAVGLRVTVDFRGNGYIAPASRNNHVTAG